MNTEQTTTKPEPRKIVAVIADSPTRRAIHNIIKAESESRKAATIAALPADFMELDWK